MAKRKGRAQRKKQRQKAAKAEERGLPQPEVVAKPAKTRKVGGDVTAAAIVSEKEGRSAPVQSRAQTEANSGTPVFAKVALGAGAVLAVFWGLSFLRKTDAPSESSNAPTNIPGEVGSSENEGTSQPETQMDESEGAPAAPPEVEPTDDENAE